MSKVNTKAQNIISTLSTESILIPLEFNWIQMRSTDEVVSRLKAEGFGTLSLDLELRVSFESGIADCSRSAHE